MPAAVSIASDKATWPITIKLRAPNRRPRASLLSRPFRSATRSRRDSRSAGPRPKAIVLSAVKDNVASSTSMSGRIRNTTFNGSAAVNDADSALVVQTLSRRPNTAPAEASSTLSVSSWRISARAARTEREPQRNLPAARGAAGQEHVGDIQAGNHEHDAGQPHQQSGERHEPAVALRTRAGGDARQRADREDLVLVLARVRRLELPRERVKPGGRRGRRHPRLQPPGQNETGARTAADARAGRLESIVDDGVVDAERQEQIG